jgi:hypothetical protein
MSRRISPIVMHLPVVMSAFLSVLMRGLSIRFGGSVQARSPCGFGYWLYIQFLTIWGAVRSFRYCSAPPKWSSWLCVISHKSTDCPSDCNLCSSSRIMG